MPTRSRPRRIARVVVIVMVSLLFVPPAAAGVATATYLFMPLPAVLPDEIPQADSLRSVVYAADGTPIGEFREAQTRVPIDANDIPDTIKRAVIAVEDSQFYDHKGVDWRGIGRALWNDVRKRQLEQGGSTITQQLVKNLYTGSDRTIVRKVREAMIAAAVERKMDKDEILAKYLNTVYMGDSVFGVEAAAQSYFRKPARDLTLSEASLLAGVLPAPSRYSPRRHPEAAEFKRNIVLDALLRTGLGTPEEVAAARGEIPKIHPPPGVRGRYPYFLDYLRVYLMDIKKYPPELIYRGGLRIETPLDSRLQDRAVQVVDQTLRRAEDPDAALVTIEPQTGYVRALVGGRDWQESKVNLALGRLGGGLGRQAGSAFKPFVLARALEAGVSPSKVYPAPRCVTPRGFQKPVCNYGGAGFGSASLAGGMHRSINTVYVQAIVDVGIQETAALAKRLGISSLNLDEPVYGGLALGTYEVSPLDMASAFSVFAARGLRAEPTPVLRIVDREGNTIEDNTVSERGVRVLEEPVADNMNHILQGVIEGGTGTRAKIGRPAAGKTGTSQNYENAWFVGYTPTLSTAVWMGYREGNIPMTGARSAGAGRVAGGSLPARMWHDFMVEAVKGVEATEFTEPAPIESLAERAKREERGGFDLGGKRDSSSIPGEGTYYTNPPVPSATAPTTTTTVAPPTTTTTTTTGPGSTTTTTGSGSGTTTTTTTMPGPQAPRLRSSPTTTTTYGDRR